ncbi:hypothetical protein OAT16_05485 [Prolixibacteraceae bacterium]|nr:hypothetical protein [Prolixibacteraceae bacterium]
MRNGLIKNIRLLLLWVTLSSSLSVLGQGLSSSLNELPSGTRGAKDTPLVCTKGKTNTFSIDASTGYDLDANDYKNDKIRWTVLGGVITTGLTSTKEEILNVSSRSSITVKWTESADVDNGHVDVKQTSRDNSGQEHCSAVTSRFYIRLNTQPVISGFVQVNLDKCTGTNGRWNPDTTFDFSGVSVSDVDGDVITRRYKIINEMNGSEVFESDVSVTPPTLGVGRYQVILIVNDGHCSVQSSVVYTLIVNKTPSPSEINYR